MAPAGEIEIPKFSIETTDGESLIDSVNGVTVGAASFATAHAGEAVVLSAPAVNGAGEAFKTWRVTAGQDSGHQQPARKCDAQLHDAGYEPCVDGIL